jgi:hypothetical protein
MKITKRQLRRIIREEKARLVNEQTPGVDRQVRDLWGAKKSSGGSGIDDDIQELMELVARAEDKATEIESKMRDVEYAEWAGGREADDLHRALQNVWTAFGMDQADF